MIVLSFFESIKTNADFNRAYYKGKSSASYAVVVYARKNGLKTVRVGITTGKKIGNAVERNRSRRVIRAAFGNICRTCGVSPGYDYVLVARGKTKYLKSSQVEQALKTCLTQLGVLK